MRQLTICLLSLVLGPGMLNAEDWPQWLGVNRDSVCNEEGLIERIPAAGLAVKWRVPVEWGYSGPAVAGGRVYLMDYVHEDGKVTNGAGTRDELTGQERILCFRADSGELIWKHEYDRLYSLSYPRGPRCTPTVSGGKVYALGAEGNLTCLEADTGKLVWSKDLPKAYRTQTPIWGYSGHPLVDGDLLYCTPGGKESLAVALDKDSGKEVWRSLSGTPSYCPPTILAWNGKKQLFVWGSKFISSLDPKTGKAVWSVSLPPGYGVASAAPRLIGENVFATGAGNVSALIAAATGTVVWKGTPKTSVGCSISTPIVVDGIIYGNDGGAGTLIAAKASDSERLWGTATPVDAQSSRARGPRNGTVFLVKNKRQYFLFNDSGDLISARLSEDGYEETGRFKVLEATNFTGSRKVVWSHPAFAQKCLFARNDEELVCVNLAEN
jgi:outer membrane protein assembly factor BamB